MTQILKIEKDGNIKLDKISNISELYKKCGFRKNEGFEHINTWKKIINNNHINIELWGRTTGKSNIKNSYVFPEPFNKTIYGNCVLIAKNNIDLVDISEEIWKTIGKTYKENTFEENIFEENIPKENTHIKVENIIPMDITSSIDLNKFSTLAVSHNENIDSDDDILSSLTDDEEYPDSELKEESYLYSSEEGD